MLCLCNVRVMWIFKATHAEPCMDYDDVLLSSGEMWHKYEFPLILTWAVDSWGSHVDQGFSSFGNLRPTNDC